MSGTPYVRDGIALITSVEILGKFESILSGPLVMGHIPDSAVKPQGSTVLWITETPYALTSTDIDTFPVMVEIPRTSNDIVLLSGVKTTLKRLAVNCELSIQVFKEFVSRSLSAETLGARERIEAMAPRADNCEKRIIASIY